MTSEDVCAQISDSVRYHTYNGKTLVYELENAAQYGIKLLPIPSETETIITETYYAEKHVLIHRETSEIIPPKWCHQLPSEIEEPLRSCSHPSSEVANSFYTDNKYLSNYQTMPYNDVNFTACEFHLSEPSAMDKSDTYDLIRKDPIDLNRDFKHDDKDFEDTESLSPAVDEDFAVMEDFASVLEETCSVFEELDDDTIEDGCSISDEKVKRIVGIVNRYAAHIKSTAEDCDQETLFAALNELHDAEDSPNSQNLMNDQIGSINYEQTFPFSVQQQVCNDNYNSLDTPDFAQFTSKGNMNWETSDYDFSQKIDFQLPFFFMNRSGSTAKLENQRIEEIPLTLISEDNKAITDDSVEGSKSHFLVNLEPSERPNNNTSSSEINSTGDEQETSGNSVLMNMIQDYVKMVMDASKELHQARKEEDPEEVFSSVSELEVNEILICDDGEKDTETLERDTRKPEMSSVGTEIGNEQIYKSSEAETSNSYPDKTEDISLAAGEFIQRKDDVEDEYGTRFEKVDFPPIAPRKSSVEKWESMTLKKEMLDEGLKENNIGKPIDQAASKFKNELTQPASYSLQTSLPPFNPKVDETYQPVPGNNPVSVEQPPQAPALGFDPVQRPKNSNFGQENVISSTFFRSDRDLTSMIEEDKSMKPADTATFAESQNTHPEGTGIEKTEEENYPEITEENLHLLCDSLESIFVPNKIECENDTTDNSKCLKTEKKNEKVLETSNETNLSNLAEGDQKSFSYSRIPCKHAIHLDPFVSETEQPLISPVSQTFVDVANQETKKTEVSNEHLIDTQLQFSLESTKERYNEEETKKKELTTVCQKEFPMNVQLETNHDYANDKDDDERDMVQQSFSSDSFRSTTIDTSIVFYSIPPYQRQEENSIDNSNNSIDSSLAEPEEYHQNKCALETRKEIDTTFGQERKTTEKCEILTIPAHLNEEDLDADFKTSSTSQESETSHEREVTETSDNLSRAVSIVQDIVENEELSEPRTENEEISLLELPIFVESTVAKTNGEIEEIEENLSSDVINSMQNNAKIESSMSLEILTTEVIPSVEEIKVLDEVVLKPTDVNQSTKMMHEDAVPDFPKDFLFCPDASCNDDFESNIDKESRCNATEEGLEINKEEGMFERSRNENAKRPEVINNFEVSPVEEIPPCVTPSVDIEVFENTDSNYETDQILESDADEFSHCENFDGSTISFLKSMNTNSTTEVAYAESKTEKLSTDEEEATEDSNIIKIAEITENEEKLISTTPEIGMNECETFQQEKETEEKVNPRIQSYAAKHPEQLEITNEGYFSTHFEFPQKEFADQETIENHHHTHGIQMREPKDDYVMTSSKTATNSEMETPEQYETKEQPTSEMLKTDVTELSELKRCSEDLEIQEELQAREQEQSLGIVRESFQLKPVEGMIDQLQALVNSEPEDTNTKVVALLVFDDLNRNVLDEVVQKVEHVESNTSNTSPILFSEEKSQIDDSMSNVVSETKSMISMNCSQELPDFETLKCREKHEQSTFLEKDVMKLYATPPSFDTSIFTDFESETPISECSENCWEEEESDSDATVIEVEIKEKDISEIKLLDVFCNNATCSVGILEDSGSIEYVENAEYQLPKEETLNKTLSEHPNQGDNVLHSTSNNNSSTSISFSHDHAHVVNVENLESNSVLSTSSLDNVQTTTQIDFLDSEDNEVVDEIQIGDLNALIEELIANILLSETVKQESELLDNHQVDFGTDGQTENPEEFVETSVALLLDVSTVEHIWNQVSDGDVSIDTRVAVQKNTQDNEQTCDAEVVLPEYAVYSETRTCDDGNIEDVAAKIAANAITEALETVSKTLSIVEYNHDGPETEFGTFEPFEPSVSNPVELAQKDDYDELTPHSASTNNLTIQNGWADELFGSRTAVHEHDEKEKTTNVFATLPNEQCTYSGCLMIMESSNRDFEQDGDDTIEKLATGKTLATLDCTFKEGSGLVRDNLDSKAEENTKCYTDCNTFYQKNDSDTICIEPCNTNLAVESDIKCLEIPLLEKECAEEISVPTLKCHHEQNANSMTTDSLFSFPEETSIISRYLMNEILEGTSNDDTESRIKHLNQSDTCKQSASEDLTPTQKEIVAGYENNVSTSDVTICNGSDLIPESSNCSVCADVCENVPTNSSSGLPTETSSTESSLNSLEQPSTSSVSEEVSYFFTTACVAALAFMSSSESASPSFNPDIIEEASKYFFSEPQPSNDNDNC